MRSSRGMGDMNPKKLGKKMPKKITADRIGKSNNTRTSNEMFRKTK